MKVEGLKKGDRVIYFAVSRHYGFKIGVAYTFSEKVERILKTKVVLSSGREMKIVNGKVDDLYPFSEKENVIREIINYHKEEFEEKLKDCRNFEWLALQELVNEKIGGK